MIIKCVERYKQIFSIFLCFQWCLHMDVCNPAGSFIRHIFNHLKKPFVKISCSFIKVLPRPCNGELLFARYDSSCQKHLFFLRVFNKSCTLCFGHKTILDRDSSALARYVHISWVVVNFIANVGFKVSKGNQSNEPL